MVCQHNRTKVNIWGWADTRKQRQIIAYYNSFLDPCVADKADDQQSGPCSTDLAGMEWVWMNTL